ncbi:DUF4861 family protein [Sphingobacterium hungaricum]|uniref:DUF4861 domain-containing protein n=1 Tax=Sphingobacterium hungaricum TaxID=2082723 RepID=A0A928YPV8_9SPHI|nr:DUF4861 family protein [Sphingobacterium hungaricum]MBE8712962.1 DUF4861 domain-containing protein [Sphingobacterium hungaricum]
MKTIILSISFFCCFAITFAQHINIKNPTDFARKELVSIPYADFQAHFKVDSGFVISNGEQEFDYQFEKLGNENPQNLLIQIEIPAKSSLKLKVIQGPKKPISSKTFARYVPERFDDFAWENDVVAFRLYGKALEGRSDDAQGMDFWAKRTENLVINKWYATGDYHADHGEGLDYYSVGQTLGAGDIALFLDGQIRYTKHYRQYAILDNGPLRTTFKLTFEPQEINGQVISLTKTISLDAGSSFNKIAVAMDNQQNNVTPFVIGVAKRNEENPAYAFDKKTGALVYWEPSLKDFGETGIAVIAPKSTGLRFDNDNKSQFLLHSTAKNNSEFIYYNGATWNKAGQNTSFESWKNAVDQKATAIQKPLQIQLKK